MVTENCLSGRRILVVEDSYLLARDTAEALTAAGAQVVGPFPGEGAAVGAIEDGMLSAAVVDINLGSGPTFAVARSLTDAKVPFLFVTGYDVIDIPVEFQKVRRLDKPINLRGLVTALGDLTEPA
jgi:DNA-binding response OmpR family regulator